MTPALLLLLAAVSGDGLAPEAPGVAARGTTLDVVVRPLDGTRKLKLLIGDADTDAPLTGSVEVEVERFGPTGKTAKAKAVPGRYPGHYLVELPEGVGRQSLVIRVTKEGGASEILAVDGIMPAPKLSVAGSAPARPMPEVPLLAVVSLSLLAFLARRKRVVLPLVIVTAFFLAGDALAHGPGGDVAPEPPGSRLYLSQEIQFALALRTQPVQSRTFQAPDGTQAARQYPAVPRSAVVERQGQKLVIVRVAPEHFVAREVTLGWAEAGAQGSIAVERGVNPGERVLVDGAAFLSNGGATAP
jgi:hypothetical protein